MVVLKDNGRRAMGNNELQNKLQALRYIYKSSNASGLLIEKQNNISWLLRGRSFVNMASENGVCSFLLTDDNLYMISSNIEINRMAYEEFAGFKHNILQYEWYESDIIEDIVKDIAGAKYLSDSDIEDRIKPLRIVLTSNEMEIYRQLGKDTAHIIEEVCFSIKPGMTELKAASKMAEMAVERNIEPVVLLVAADERILKYRHPLPTVNPIKDYIMLVAGFRRHGLIANITRFVSFKDMSSDIIEKRNACIDIAATAIVNTRPGRTAAEVFQMIKEKYAQYGYPDEWKLHHQGGITGYNSREYKVTDKTSVRIGAGQAYAWNPSITGFKCEDTFLVDDDVNEVITSTPNIPSLVVETDKGEIRIADILNV
jgi:Xaa-Pro dipeptidase